MNGRTLFAIAVAFPLAGALAGVAMADNLFPQSTEETALAPLEAPVRAEESAPASITIMVHTSSLAHDVAYLDEGESFTMPVYFSPGTASISEEAQMALAALVDEAAAAPSVTLTVSARGRSVDRGTALQDMRAIAVFDQLSTLGIPPRVMALDLDPTDAESGDNGSLFEGAAI